MTGVRRQGRGGVRRLALLLLLVAGPLAACAGAPTPRPYPLAAGGRARPRAYNRPYVVHGRQYVPEDDPRYDEVGMASWYGYESGRRTADGEVFTLSGLTAAHRTLPIPSLLEVTNLATGARVVVRLNDRGPFASGRLIDLSREAARRLGVLQAGSARVRVRYLGPAAPARTELAQVADRAEPRPPPAARAPELEATELVADLP